MVGLAHACALERGSKGTWGGGVVRCMLRCGQDVCARKWCRRKRWRLRCAARVRGPVLVRGPPHTQGYCVCRV